jgi:tyrosyl-tRNA synthetase
VLAAPRFGYVPQSPISSLENSAPAMASVDEQLRIISAGAVDLIREADLRRKLARGTPLRVKLGIDPTASDIHLGFAVVLRKLRQFQDLGHVAVLIIGDFTALVGDPSGRSATRPRLSKAEVDGYAETYLEQVRRILDFAPERLEVHRNASWLSAMDMEAVLGLTASTTVARMLERDDFAKRYAGGSPISLTEFIYPLLQGQDSVEVRADVELGGTDQLFNNLMGRTLQEQRGQDGQVVLTTPLLEGLDGRNKMSKSLGNYIGIAEPPADQFGKLMSLPDALMPRYFQLTTGWHPDRVDEVVRDLTTGTIRAVEAKRLLARTVVDLYHGEGRGAAAEAEFDQVFRSHEAPSDVPEHLLDPAESIDGRVRLANVLRQAGLVSSNKEGVRMIQQGAVRLDGVVVEDADAAFAPGALDGTLVQVGRRRWARLRVPG